MKTPPKEPNVFCMPGSFFVLALIKRSIYASLIPPKPTKTSHSNVQTIPAKEKKRQILIMFLNTPVEVNQYYGDKKSRTCQAEDQF